MKLIEITLAMFSNLLIQRALFSCHARDEDIFFLSTMYKKIVVSYSKRVGSSPGNSGNSSQ